MDPKDQVNIWVILSIICQISLFLSMLKSLEARASILAAADLIGGHYEKIKSLKQNIEMIALLMSTPSWMIVTR